MQIINKIGFFIAEPRQIDYYKNILNNLPDNLKLIIINDFEHSEQSKEYLKIRNFCEENNFKFVSSKALFKNNQKVLLVVGTGNKSYHSKKLSALSYIF